MIIGWVIGLILSFLGILLFKNSRIKAKDTFCGYIPERPVLKVWSLFLFILGALLPVFNIFIGIVMIVFWDVSVYGDKDWICKDDFIGNRIVQLLNKPIK